ncbi:MAG: MBOAT family protein, partial [Candidatus Hydrogenedentota bacterium]
MLFNSLEFVIFFALVIPLYAVLRGHWALRKTFLLACSYLFYMAWNPPYVLLLVFSTFLDFTAGNQIAKSSRRSVRVGWMTVSLIGNLGVLAFFKYSDFLLSSIWPIMPASAVYPPWVANIILPMGISFYTFQSLSYTIDVYRDKSLRATSFLDFAVYVSFFPQLVAGPIIRSREFLPQLTEEHSASSEDILLGMDQMFRGFFKKVVLADTLAVYVDVVYAAPEQFGSGNHVLAIYAYAFQIYFDFSGYSDIAIGTARILGFRVPCNFNLPYLAAGPSDFWQRWHISLSTWLRDYLYISLGGSRATKFKTNRNLFITMLLGGLWHGAAWNFVMWGAFHGFWLGIHRVLFRDRELFKVNRYLSIFLTFHLVCLAWIFFRAQNIETITTVLSGFTNFERPFYLVTPDVLIALAIGFTSHLLGASTKLQRIWDNSFFAIKGSWYAFIIIAIFFFTKTTAS